MGCDRRERLVLKDFRAAPRPQLMREPTLNGLGARSCRCLTGAVGAGVVGECWTRLSARASKLPNRDRKTTQKTRHSQAASTTIKDKIISIDLPGTIGPA